MHSAMGTYFLGGFGVLVAFLGRFVGRWGGLVGCGGGSVAWTPDVVVARGC